VNGAGGVFLGSVYSTLQFKTGGFAGDVAGAQRGLRGLGNSFNQAENQGSDFSNSLGGAVRTGLLATGAAAVAAGGASVKMAGDFEQSMSVLRYNSSATAAEFQLLSARARDLGQDAALPGISAADAANAMNELAKAGLSVNDVLAASKGVLSLAKAGNIDVGLAATTTARALNAFGLEGSQASRIADLLAATANKSTADVQDLAFGLQMAGAGSKQMNVPLQDTVTALGLFANAGIAGSDAGTSLKAMFQQLANPTAESAALMRQLGLDFFDAKGNFIGLEATASQLQTKLGTLSAEQRNAALATIFGADASRVAGILANEGAGGFDKMRDAVTKQGAAADAAKAYNNGFTGALDSFISSAQTVGIALGTSVLPPLTGFLRALAQPEKTIGSFVGWLNNANPVVQGLSVFLLALAGGAAVYAVGIGAATVATTAFAIAMAVLASPIFLVVAAVAAVAAVAFVVYRNWGGITSFFADIFGSVIRTTSNWWGSFVGFFQRLPGTVINAIGNLGGLLYNSGRDMIHGLLNGAGSLLGSVGRFFLDRLPGWIVGPFKKALGIHSPSTVFAGYGTDVVQGLASGITASRGLVSSAMKGLDAQMTVSPTRPSSNLPSQAGLFTQQAQQPAPARGGSPVNIEKYEVHNNIDPERVLRDMSRRVALA